MARAAALIAALFIIALPDDARAADPPSRVTVDSAGDAGPASGDCDLRDAIETVLTDGAPTDGCSESFTGARDKIDFDIGLDGSAHTIAVASQLPFITQPIEIDGTNGGSLPNIRIDGSSAGRADGLILYFGSDGSHVHDIGFHSFSDDGIRVASDGNLIERVLSGTDGITDLGNGGDGVQLEGDDNTVSKSIISGNDREGINVAPSSGSTGSGTTINGSVIGMKPDGTAPMANDLNGINVLLGSAAAGDGITIGGAGPSRRIMRCPALGGRVQPRRRQRL